eukprot:2008110-Pleurochrysis_carterae.AAC.1
MRNGFEKESAMAFVLEPRTTAEESAMASACTQPLTSQVQHLTLICQAQKQAQAPMILHHLCEGSIDCITYDAHSRSCTCSRKQAAMIIGEPSTGFLQRDDFAEQLRVLQQLFQWTTELLENGSLPAK